MSDFQTIQEAKDFLRENIEKGEDCPCCGQLVKLYKRKLTSGMARALINLYRESKQDTLEYVHISRLGRLNGGEFAQLKRWGLIIDKDNDDPELKRTSGFWAITGEGIDFVERRSEVPKYVFTYNMITVTNSRVSTTIEQALGTKFNYAELMGELFDKPRGGTHGKDIIKGL